MSYRTVQSRNPDRTGPSLGAYLPVLLFLGGLAFWTYELLAENPVPPSISQAIPDEWKFYLAKGLHVAAYAVLTFLAYLMPVPRWVLGVVIVGLLLHGVGTEVGQTFTKNRHGSVRDVVLDWVGVGMGLLMIAAWNALLAQIRPRSRRFPV